VAKYYALMFFKILSKSFLGVSHLTCHNPPNYFTLDSKTYPISFIVITTRKECLDYQIPLTQLKGTQGSKVTFPRLQGAT